VAKKPAAERNQLSGSFREAFRYTKAGRIRVYNLRTVSDAEAELWVVTAEGKSRRLTTFNTIDEERVFLQDVQRELRDGGWRQV